MPDPTELSPDERRAVEEYIAQLGREVNGWRRQRVMFLISLAMLCITAYGAYKIFASDISPENDLIQRLEQAEIPADVTSEEYTVTVVHLAVDTLHTGNQQQMVAMMAGVLCLLMAALILLGIATIYRHWNAAPRQKALIKMLQLQLARYQAEEAMREASR